VGLDVAGLAALAPTLRRLVVTVRGLQLTGLASLAELHRLRHLQLRIQRGFYTLPGDQVLVPPLDICLSVTLTLTLTLASFGAAVRCFGSLFSAACRAASQRDVSFSCVWLLKSRLVVSHVRPGVLAAI
jgi:hypothetical protein